MFTLFSFAFIVLPSVFINVATNDDSNNKVSRVFIIDTIAAATTNRHNDINYNNIIIVKLISQFNEKVSIIVSKAR